LLATDRDGRVRELAYGRFRRPRLSPDGARIALESWEEGSWDLRVVSRDGSGSRRVTSDPANELEPAWSLDGASLLFASDRGRGLGSTAVYRIDLR
jgi:Tol biopolymer transport system component